jgi:hypothetical protein
LAYAYPAKDGSQPHPSWKGIDFVQAALPQEDRQRTAQEGGEITMDDYVEHLSQGRS